MKIITKELSALIATVAIKNGKVADWDFLMELQVLYTLVRVFHAFALSDITDDP